MSKTLGKKIAISAIIGTLLTAAAFYLWLPAINGYDPEFWMFLIAMTVFYAVPFWLAGKGKNFKIDFKDIISKSKNDKGNKKAKSLGFKIFLAIIITLAAIVIVGSLISSQVFNARKYASIITVNEAVFAQDMQESEQITNIALMDSASAQIIGNRALDKLADVVSQFVAGDSYTQINFEGLPKKVTSLEYADFFKWINNKDSGIPGYIMVDPVKNNAEYKALKKPIKYVESGYFGDDLYRKLRFEYPTKMFDFISYEIDEQGNPYYIVSCVKPQIFPFGAKDVEEIIIFDPCTGESEIRPIEDVPSWIDTAYSGDLAMQKYNWHGTLSGGFINSIIGNKGCKMATDDYGYITIGDDVWYFTGVTSVTADSSNIGFILTNARTGEYKYYAIGGAEEHSAMNAAEGEVQEKGYEASFPSLVNIAGEATYIMVLKDASGIVKLYALVNVENYNLVVTGETQDEVMKKYKALLVSEGEVNNIPTPEALKATVKIENIRDAVISGNSVVYLYGDDGLVYKGQVATLEKLMLISVGDTVNIEYIETDTQGIREIIGFEIVEAQ